MPATARKTQPVLFGKEKPRLGPPTPARSLVKHFEQAASDIGLEPMPWQRYAGRFLYAIGPGEQWLYPEVAVIVSRQQGKTEMLPAHIICRLESGRRILHAAQSRELPRETFKKLAPLVEKKWKGEAIIRRGAGQESIEVPGGGYYRIVAASGGAPRGQSIDDLLLDEVRELEEDFVGAALPTMTASANPQVLYLSNAGTEDSLVLNSVRDRADEDRALAYLEWSAGPERAVDDIEGWAEANPALGHITGVRASLERSLNSYRLSGNLARFETEHLCRWVTTLRERLVDDADWLACRGPLGKPLRPAFAVALDPDAKRASVAMAWRVGDVIALTMVIDRQGDVDVDALRDEVATLARRLAADVGYDPLQDTDLVRTVVKGKAKPINGAKFATASARFAQRVASHAIRWADADPVTDDLTWTARKPDGEQGSFHAVRAKDDRPITASLAAVRAVWLASDETPRPPRIR